MLLGVCMLDFRKMSLLKNSDYIQVMGKVGATFPLTRHTLVPEGLQSRRDQFIHK